jgi:Na+-transporting methylmalonyl-CoA/oxaloacetate decarboxylase gamma subunit
MLTNLLTSATLPEGYQKVSIGTSALYALIGYAVVFAGIAFLIFIVWLVGKIVSKPKAVPQKTVTNDEPALKLPTKTTDSDEEVDEETVAAIMAVLMAYYETNYPKCEFTVKRIKRVRRNDYA